MDYPIVGNRSLDRFDALIIGSGPTGCSLAVVLATSGLKVLVLEAGPNYYVGLDDPSPGMPQPKWSNDEIKMTVRGMVTPDPLIMPRTFRPSEADGDRTVIGNINMLPQTVGGGSVHADMKFPRFRPQDFQLGTLLGVVPGANFADWPVTYDELEPFYTYAEYSLGVQGQAGLDPNEPPRSKPFPMPPGPPAYSALRIAEGAAKLGYTAFLAPTAINSRPYAGRPACRECGMCGSFGCPIGAKGTAAAISLRRALLSGNCQLWPETRAVRLVLNGGHSDVSGVEAILPDGNRMTFTAGRYILAGNSIEDAKLCLLSEPGGVGNSQDLIGRNFMLHSHLTAFGIFAERVHTYRGRGSTYCLTDFRGVAGDPNRPLGGIVEIGGSGTPIGEALNYIYQLRSGVGAGLKAMMRQGVGRDRGVAVSLFGEDAPQLTNRVDLDPQIKDIYGSPAARVTYRSHAFEEHAKTVYGPKLLDIVMAGGAKYGALLPEGDLPGTAHLHGTLRFGSDPKTSVCQPDGRFHELGNLYGSGGALFPTSSGFNPTLTMIALSLRIAGEMVSPGSPEKALPPLPSP